MAINNGSDMNDGPEYQFLPEAVAQGLTDEATIDIALTRNMKQFFQAGLFDDPKQGKYSKRRRSNVAVIIVKVIFIS